MGRGWDRCRRPLRAGAVFGLLAAGLAPSAGRAGEPWEVKTVRFRAEAVEGAAMVRYTWLGEVRNRGEEPAHIAVRLTAWDASGRPVAHLDVPAVEVEPAGAIREEAVFELGADLWGRVYSVDAAGREEEEP